MEIIMSIQTEQWLAIRKEAGLEIDPQTAEVYWEYGQILDPYGVYQDLPEECQQVGRVYFARSPDSDIWVCFYDLPDATREALREKHKGKLAFPAGLSLELLGASIQQ
jgi:hypothetical protein